MRTEPEMQGLQKVANIFFPQTSTTEEKQKYYSQFFLQFSPSLESCLNVIFHFWLADPVREDGLATDLRMENP
jgi:hypothetical protein